MVEVKDGRILVVDGDPRTRRARTRTLRDAGLTVFETERLADAALLLRQIAPRLLVIDAAHDTGRRAAPRARRGRGLSQHLDAADLLGLRSAPPRLRLTPIGISTATPAADATLPEPVTPEVLIATTRLLLRLGRAEHALGDSVALERTARDEADAANRVKDDFLGTLSHELRTPLHAIVGWIALLRARPFDDETRAHALEVIERNAKAQTALIEDLLDVSRITLGQLRLTWRPVELAPVVFSAVDAIRPTAETKDVTISTDIALDPEITVRGDATRLRQIFWNLLSNAVKFTPEGGRVNVRTRAEDGRATIEVIDTGRGISPEFLARMFERFQRADRSTTTSDRGLGLGLAIARQLAELHGGGLSAASAGVDRGATFVVTLPQLSARESATRLWRGSARRAAEA